MRVLDESYIASMKSDEKRWFAYALAAIVGADGHIESNELQHLETSLRFLESDEEVQNILRVAQSGELPKLPILKVPRQTAFQILLHIGAVAISDAVLSKSEVSAFKFIGAKLGFEPRFSMQLVKVLFDSLAIDKQIDQLEHLASIMEPAYHQV